MSDTEDAPVNLGPELYTVLSRAHSWVNAHAMRDIRCHNLNPTEFAILELLYHKGPRPLQQIGGKILISSGNITYAVDKLEEKELLTERQRAEHVLVLGVGLGGVGFDGQGAARELDVELHRVAVALEILNGRFLLRQ